MKIIYIAITVGLFTGAFVYADDNNSQQSQSTQPIAQEQQEESGIQSEAAGAETKGQKLTMNQLPQEVQKTIRAHTQGANVENIQKKTMNGQTVYSASSDKGNARTQVVVAQDGSLLQLQQTADVAIGTALPQIGQTEIQVSELPQAVQQAIKQRAGSQQVGNITESSQQGKTLYHAGFNEGGVHTDLFISEDGKIVAEVQQTALFVAPLERGQKMSVSTAPEAVQKTIREQAGASRVTDLDKGTWKGETAYKVMVEKNGKPMPMVISENGNVLSGEISEAAGAEQPQHQEQEEQKQYEQDQNQSRLQDN